MTTPDDPSPSSAPASPEGATTNSRADASSTTSATSDRPTRRPLESFDRARFAAIAISVIALASGTALPSGHFTDESGTPVMWRGATFVLCGWFGPMMGGPICGWYANPMLILSWILLALRRYRGASIVLVIAAVLALSSATLFGVEVWQNEGGVNNLRLQHFGIGFYVWLVGVLAPTGVAIAGWRRDRGFAKHGPAPRGF
ncbi:MAG: hypothetical protein MUE69_00040 [Myxococcota bacterium]|jgi:hypothetical protein|nr:hypothetical protein [Myxococcota bacterium]